jgi:N-acetylmuramoyl-L-alanine amidase
MGYALRDREPADAVSGDGAESRDTLFSPYKYIPVIDPGHGGFDPGTQSESGILEKDINLAIGLRTDLIMRFLGLRTVMTRDSDEVVHDIDAVSIADRKASDTNNRVELINGVENGVLLSIHQNNFDQRQYYGAQVFYKGGENKAFADIMQAALRDALDPENTRKSSTGFNSALHNRAEKPAILIESGFLSNPEEAELLNTGQYQVKVAMAVTKGFLDWSDDA